MSTLPKTNIMKPLSLQDAKKYILGRKATFTIVNTETGKRFTYKTSTTKERYSPLFVKMLTGADNDSSYSYIGFIKHTDKSNFIPKRQYGKSVGVDAAKWLYKAVAKGDLKTVKVYHHNTCGRCGRTLTTPESIVRGYGPSCVNKIAR